MRDDPKRESIARVAHVPGSEITVDEAYLFPRHVMVVGMAGSGNLGDDLISSLLAKHIRARFPAATISVLSGGQRNPFGYHASSANTVVGGPGTRGGLRDANLRSLFRATNLLVIGGGGLIQDTHNLATPWKWLRYMNWVDRAHCSIWGVGLGIGPLRHALTRAYLRSALPGFDVLQVRDTYSGSLALSLGGTPILSSDIVAGSDVRSFGFSATRDRDDYLGCSLRPWPGFTLADAATLLKRAGDELGLKRVRFFTFEWYASNLQELRFQEAVAGNLSRDGYHCETLCYGRDPIELFVDAFVHVRAAVAMRLHANVLWLKAGVPVKPISYAPKVQSVFESGEPTNWTNIGPLKVGGTFQKVWESPAYTLPCRLEPASKGGPGRAFDLLFSTARSLRQVVRDAKMMISDS